MYLVAMKADSTDVVYVGKRTEDGRHIALRSVINSASSRFRFLVSASDEAMEKTTLVLPISTDEDMERVVDVLRRLRVHSTVACASEVPDEPGGLFDSNAPWHIRFEERYSSRTKPHVVSFSFRIGALDSYERFRTACVRRIGGRAAEDTLARAKTMCGAKHKDHIVGDDDSDSEDGGTNFDDADPAEIRCEQCPACVEVACLAATKFSPVELDAMVEKRWKRHLDRATAPLRFMGSAKTAPVNMVFGPEDHAAANRKRTRDEGGGDSEEH